MLHVSSKQLRNMKKGVLIILIFGLHLASFGQDLMTIREVFDFKIGDEFHTNGSADYEPQPNADRITIIGKYYSENGDTLSYIEFHDSYYTTFENEVLEYYFWTRTDTTSYTNLDSSLIYYDYGFEFNQYIEYSTVLCDILVNGNAYAIGPGYEDDWVHKEYGKGLGQTISYWWSFGANAIITNNDLFYYKKGDYECGIKDTLTVSIYSNFDMQPDVIIYPNPTKSQINVIIKPQLEINKWVILNSLGQEVMILENISRNNRINLIQLPKGFYFLKIETKENIIVKKIIRE